jgi:hypothetical protein
VLEGLQLAGGALDAEPEQVTDAADVAPDDWLSLRMRSSRSAWVRRVVCSHGNLRPTGTSRGAVRRLTSRCGLGVLGRARARWSNRAVKRVRTGTASEMDLPSMMRRPSTVSVSHCTHAYRPGHRPYRQTVTHTDHSSGGGLRVANRDPQRMRPSTSPNGETNLSGWRLQVCRQGSIRGDLVSTLHFYTGAMGHERGLYADVVGVRTRPVSR